MATKKPYGAARRPNRTGSFELPADGTKEPAPKWPLSKQRPGEAGLWRELWQLPQATAWRDLGSTRIVARYTRLVLRAEEVGSDGSGVTYQAECRRLEDALGLSPRAAFLLNFRLVESAGDADPEGAPSVTTLEQYRRAVGDD